VSALVAAGPAYAQAPPDGPWLAEVWSYTVSGFLWSGALLAVQITLLGMSCGIVLGLGLALMRLSRIGVVRGVAWAYIFAIRGTPLLLQLVFVFDALPAVGIRLDSFSTAVIGFALNEAAFSAEIIRGGILSVNRTQSVAAASLGMGGWLTLRRIILPQAMRVIVPPTGNQAINLLKATALVAFISGGDLLSNVQEIYAVNYAVMPLLVVATLGYLVLVTVATIGQYYLERSIGKGYTRSSNKKSGAAKINVNLDAA
jgi:polar amino acid transport system permease protein